MHRAIRGGGGGRGTHREESVIGRPANRVTGREKTIIGELLRAVSRRNTAVSLSLPLPLPLARSLALFPLFLFFPLPLVYYNVFFDLLSFPSPAPSPSHLPSLPAVPFLMRLLDTCRYYKRCCLLAAAAAAAAALNGPIYVQMKGNRNGSVSNATRVRFWLTNCYCRLIGADNLRPALSFICSVFYTMFVHARAQRALCAPSVFRNCLPLTSAMCAAKRSLSSQIRNADRVSRISSTQHRPIKFSLSLARARARYQRNAR